MPISVPRLYRNRFGVYYLRLLIPKRLKAEYGRGEFRRSLHTKDAHSAKLLALQWNIQWEEQRVSKPRLSDFARLTQGNVSVRKYEIDIQKGTLKTDGPEDHRNAMEALEAMKTLASAQSRAPVVPTLAPSAQAPYAPFIPPTKKISDAWIAYEAEIKLAGGKRHKTIGDARNAVQAFSNFVKDSEIGRVTVGQAVSFKEGMVHKTVFQAMSRPQLKVKPVAEMIMRPFSVEQEQAAAHG